MSLQQVSERTRQRIRYAEIRRRLRGEPEPPARVVKKRERKPEPTPIQAREEPPTPPPQATPPEPTFPLDFWPGTGQPRPHMRPLGVIMREVADEFGLRPHDLRAETRNGRVVKARRKFCYRAVTETFCSYVHIGKFCGGRCHTTVMYTVSTYCILNGLPLPRGLEKTMYVVRKAEKLGVGE